IRAENVAQGFFGGHRKTRLTAAGRMTCPFVLFAANREKRRELGGSPHLNLGLLSCDFGGANEVDHFSNQTVKIGWLAPRPD
ncbi:hypothetical protein, partial [Mycobacterium marinum]|uniref:hypothetical protein n=1 Tax=Mycobacterium marinum TaxID=1781 RepID=UPI0021C378A3